MDNNIKTNTPNFSTSSATWPTWGTTTAPYYTTSSYGVPYVDENSLFVQNDTRRIINGKGKYIDIDLVCIVGPIGSGKDYKARALEKEGYIKVSFADYLRSSCWSLLLWKPENEKQYREFKDNLIGPGNITGREFMFSVEGLLKGTHGDSIFIRKTIDYIVNHYSNKFVISDLRFESEYNALVKKFENLRVIFSNYKSDHYELRKTKSEEMAVRFAEIGYKDGQQLTEKDFKNLWIEPETLL
jgi:hypothetical protein